MRELDELDEDAWGTVFRDVVLLALVGFVAMVILLLPHITQAKKQKTDESRVPGNITVEAHWPSNMPVDVDLWVQAPGEYPVGYWNQGGPTFNLLRDDLGAEGDATSENYEIAYSRGIPEGEYIVNVHMYGPLKPGTTVPVNVVVGVKKRYESELSQILKTVVRLDHRHQEETAFRFRLTRDGDLIPGSVNTLRRSLITGGNR